MLNCERSAIYNDLVFILAAGPFVGNKAEQRCQFTSFEGVISSEVKIFKYTPLSRLNSYKCCFMFISFSFLFNTIAQLCHKMLLVGLFLFVCLVTCATPQFCFISLFVCLFTCATSRCVALGTFSTSPSAPLPYLCVQCEFVRYL